MKTKYLIVTVLALMVAGSVLLFSSRVNIAQKYQPRNMLLSSAEQGINGAMEWLNMRRVNPTTGTIELKDIERALTQVREMRMNNSSKTTDLTWTELGPDNVGGRTRAILIDKDDPSLVFAGSVSGGLWKSSTGGQSWVPVAFTNDPNSAGINGSDLIATLAISSICQATNGDIYVGTGEWFGMDPNPVNQGIGGTWFYGQGIWKSQDTGRTFTKIPSTWSDTDTTSKNTFCFVNKLAADPANATKIYAATARGLRITEDGGGTWTNPLASAEGNNMAEDVKVGTNGTVVVSIAPSSGAHYAYIGNNGNYVKKIISTDAYRTEFAISPEDDNYIYCMAAKSNKHLQGVYKSTNNGQDWTSIANEGIDFNILGTQGNYDNVIAVYPNNKDKIMCGGTLNLWVYTSTTGWNTVSMWDLPSIYPWYVHADHHAIVFHPTNPNILYIGSDGGVSKSSDGGLTFVTLNKRYNVTQFYSIACSPEGRVMGGTQDNGTQYIDYSGNTVQTATKVKGGDGGYCDFSSLKPGVNFGTTYYGSLCRIDEQGASLESKFFFSTSANKPSIIDEYWPANAVIGSTSTPCVFVTPVELWESFNDSLSTDSVTFKADRNYSAGEMIYAKSKMDNRELTQALSRPLLKDSTIRVQDIYQSILAICLKNRVWITRQALDFSINPANWYPINSKTLNLGSLYTLAISKDGNNIYFSNGYSLWRSSNLNYSRSARQMNADTLANCTITTQKIATFTGFITSIAVDPGNPGNVVVTLGNYGDTSGKIWYSTNAATTTSTLTTDNFTSKDNFVFPVYTALVVWNDYKKVIIGTEYGIYSTDDITASSPTWIDQNNNSMGNVPVFMLRQQTIPNTWRTGVTNHGTIYAATHGRGLWKCETFKGPVGIEENTVSNNPGNVCIYPNPVKDNAHIALELSKTSDVYIHIYDLQGRQVKSLLLHNQGEGSHNYPVSVSEFRTGTYILNVIAGDKKVVSKFTVY
ncbi:MAG: T9SS type A sorting domain-containing protein [Bacteroidia bacterium]|nr:T9SS type A sorting domain-containing protein [Bacteroidia bacterium]